jgi:replicative DNA helicase
VKPTVENPFERVIIGGMVSDEKLLKIGLEMLSADDFVSSLACSFAFEAMVAMSEAEQTVDVASICENVRPDVYTQIVKMQDDYMATSDTVPAFRQKCVALAALSDRTYAYNEASRIFTAKDKPDGAMLADQMQSVAERLRVRHSSPVDGNQIGTVAYDAIRMAQNYGKNLIPFGIPSIDAHIMGMGPGEVFIIGARTGVGKSSLCLYPALSCAMRGKWAVYLTTEMSKEDMAVRMMACMSGVRQNTIRGQYKATREEMDLLGDAINAMQKMPLYIEASADSPATIEKFLAKRAAEGMPVRVLVVDYIQQLSADRSKNNRQEELTEISRKLKRMAVKYQLTVVLAAQLNRAKNEFERPTKEYLRESGALENDADMILLLWKDMDDKSAMHVNLDKCRRGTTRDFELGFDGAVMRITDRSMVKGVVRNEKEDRREKD